MGKRYIMAAMVATLPNKDAARVTALKLYSGEVIMAFREKNIGLGLVKNREISGGKSSQFIVTGKAAAADIQTHVRGEEVIGKVLANDEVVITVTSRYVHTHFLDGLDKDITQYEATSELAFQSGEVLATKIDKDIFAEIGNVTSAFTPLAGQVAAGTVVATGYAAATTAGARGDFIVAAMFEAQANLNVKNVTEAATFVTAPAKYYELVQSGAIDKDFTTNNGGLDSGRIAQVAGIPIVWTNHLDVTTNPKLIGLLFTKDIMGVVSAMNMTSEVNYDYRRLGWQYTSYYALGMGTLNPTGLEVINDDSV